MNAQKLQAGDVGVSLIELIVYLAIGALILSLMAGLLINGLDSQTGTNDRDTATGKAAVITNSIQTSIRNANAGSTPFRLESDGKSLRALVATGADGWECRAWRLTDTGDMMYKTSNSTIELDSTGWTALATGIRGTLGAGNALFAQSGSNQLTIGFTVTVGAATVPISSGVTAQATIGSTGSCW